MGKLAAPITKTKKVAPGHLQGCTGKTAYIDIRKARSVVYIKYKVYGTISQVYKCNHCSGYHLTTTRIRKLMSCPALPRIESEPHSVHVFTHRKMRGPEGWDWVASCIYCAVMIDTYKLMTPEQTEALMGAIPVNRFQERFRQSILGLTVSRPICLNEHQQRLLEAMCRISQ